MQWRSSSHATPANRQCNSRRVPEIVRAWVHSAAGWRSRPSLDHHACIRPLPLSVAALHRDHQLFRVGAWVEIEVSRQVEDTHAVEGAPIAPASHKLRHWIPAAACPRSRCRNLPSTIRCSPWPRPRRCLRQEAAASRHSQQKDYGGQYAIANLVGWASDLGSNRERSCLERSATFRLGRSRCVLVLSSKSLTAASKRLRFANPNRNVRLKRQPPVGIGISRCRVDRR